MTLASDRFITETYREYVGVKLHFNDNNFIYKNPNQLSRLKPDQLNKRNDREWFFRLANIFNNKPKERLDYIVTQFKENKDAWIGDFFLDSAEKNHNVRMRTIQSIDYYIDKDIDDIIIKYDDRDLDSILKVNSDRPIIYKEMNLKDETLCLLDKIFIFEDNSFNPLWANKLFMFRKYSYFLDFNNNKLSSIEKKLKTSLKTSSVNQTEFNKEETLEHLFD